MTQQDAHTLLSHLINAGIITWSIGLALYIYRTRILHRIHNQKETNHARSTIRPNHSPIKTHTFADLTEEINAAHTEEINAAQSAGAGKGIVFPEV